VEGHNDAQNKPSKVHKPPVVNTNTAAVPTASMEAARRHDTSGEPGDFFGRLRVGPITPLFQSPSR
jgi:hypothetical protein